MPKKLAIDWDETEVRLVAAQCSGRNVKVTDAAVVPVTEAGVIETLRGVIQRRGLENVETLVAIGRGRAELRELQLPPVPDDELPDMVRFQAIKNFANAGDTATVDYLVTNRSDSSVEMIAAAVGPSSLTEIRETCEAAELTTKRIALRPLAAAALYLANHPSKSGKDTVLIDLLSDDAEIVVAREGRVIFVRTVRMPSGEAARGRALAGELKRSLVACGSSGSPDRVVLWGRESVHASDVQMLADASGSQVQLLDPFTLVDVDRKAAADMPDHVGRLAPLVGLLAADEAESDRLIDFLNPRERVEETPSPYRNAVMIGVPVAAVLLLAFAVYSQMKGLDQQIAELKTANAQMQPDVDAASASRGRTETVDKFLDGDVNWLNEIRRLANTMPPSDQLIVRGISADTDVRNGGGTLVVSGAVTDPSVIDEFETSMRDAEHRVTGDGASEQKTEDAYRWGFTESITVSAESVRNARYTAMVPTQPDESPPDLAEDPGEQPSEDVTEELQEETAPESPAETSEQPVTEDDLAVDAESEVQS